MKTIKFTSKNVIKKLVAYYGLPAFLFNELNDENFSLLSDKKIITVRLISYSKYNKLNDVKLNSKNILIFEDHWHSHQEIIASKIGWYANTHEKINARNCSIVKISHEETEHFLNKFHLMNYAKSTYNYALIHGKQICAVASFSHGRKMNRLPEGKLGYELIRFATVPNVSITGGLSKLLNCFAKENKPGDIMTYVDPLLGDASGLKKIGFIQTEITKPIKINVNIKSHERLHKSNPTEKSILTFNTIGNIKLVKTF